MTYTVLVETLNPAQSIKQSCQQTEMTTGKQFRYVTNTEVDSVGASILCWTVK